MNRLTNAVLLIAVAGLAVAAQRMFSTPEVFADAETQPLSSVEAELISVDPSPDASGQTPRLRQAMVKLASGEVVRATVPGGCVVFAGERTRVSKLGGGSRSTYIVVENSK